MRALVITACVVAALPAAAAADDAVPPPPPAVPSPPPSLALGVDGAARVGHKQVALVGQRATVKVTVKPFVDGQSVELNAGRDGGVVSAPVVEGSDGSGTADFKLRVSHPGKLEIAAKLLAQDGTELATVTRTVTALRGRAHRGSRGVFVKFLQSRLAAEGYAVSRSGRYDSATGRAVLTFRKVNRMHRTQSVNRRIALRLANGDGAFRPRHPDAGRHVEANLTRQVVALIDENGDPYRVYPMSSGKPSTPTVVGTFHFYSKTRGTNAKGMVDANYFVRGYAIHGYKEVPTYAASHGCIRIPIPNAAAVFRWIRTGDRVDVYR